VAGGERLVLSKKIEGVPPLGGSIHCGGWLVRLVKQKRVGRGGERRLKKWGGEDSLCHWESLTAFIRYLVVIKGGSSPGSVERKGKHIQSRRKNKNGTPNRCSTRLNAPE